MTHMRSLVLSIVLGLVMGGGVGLLVLLLCEPVAIGIVPANARVEIGTLDSEPVLVFRSSAMNRLGVVQGVGYRVDHEARRIHVRAFAVRWHPFSMRGIQAGSPLVIPWSDFQHGEYCLYVWDGTEDVQIGRVCVDDGALRFWGVTEKGDGVTH